MIFLLVIACIVERGVDSVLRSFLAPVVRAKKGNSLKIATRIVVVCGLVFGAAGLVATAAKAGMKSAYEVSIVGTLRGASVPSVVASGSIGSVRASADTRQYIGCQTIVDNNNASIKGTCWANDATGYRVQCDISASSGQFWNLQMIDAMRSINPQSYIEFSFAGLAGATSGTCTSLTVENGSNLRTASP